MGGEEELLGLLIKKYWKGNHPPPPKNIHWPNPILHSFLTNFRGGQVRHISAFYIPYVSWVKTDAQGVLGNIPRS